MPTGMHIAMLAFPLHPGKDDLMETVGYLA